MRYFLHIAYDGTNYSGWQRQKSTPHTVQQTLEQALSRILKKDITVTGCGRTDAGVHASQYILQVNIAEALTNDMKFRLNKNLPHDIVVYDIVEVKENQHCRHDAIGRTYDYFIHWKKDPMLIRYSTFYDYEALDFDVMKQATSIIKRTIDFRALCKSPDLYKHTRCSIKNCALYVHEEQGRLRFSITSNRFLRGMIRMIIFYLLRVGTGKMTLEDFDRLLSQQEESVVENRPAPPNGLFLSKIDYSFIAFEERHHLLKMLKVGLS